VVRDPRWPDPVLTKDDCVPGCVLSAPHFDACQNTVSVPPTNVVVATELRCLHGQCVEAKAYGKHAQGYTDDDIDRIVAKGLNAEARLTVAVDVVELAEDVARTLLEADGPCPYCGGGWCSTCDNNGGFLLPCADGTAVWNPCFCNGDEVPHAADCALDLLFNKARAALGKE
jgi:hypothetical protein